MFYLASIYIYIYIKLYMYACVKALWKFKNVLRKHKCINNKVKWLNGFRNVF